MLLEFLVILRIVIIQEINGQIQDTDIKVISSVPGVAGDGSRDLYHSVRSSFGIFRAKYDTSC